ncbi:MAG: hypothetical protein SVY53_12085 [Chloroflexota bacterium]|nr:hypothetical protein [Chloroflexota bacterium]
MLKRLWFAILIAITCCLIIPVAVSAQCPPVECPPVDCASASLDPSPSLLSLLLPTYSVLTSFNFDGNLYQSSDNVMFAFQYPVLAFVYESLDTLNLSLFPITESFGIQYQLTL